MQKRLVCIYDALMSRNRRRQISTYRCYLRFRQPRISLRIQAVKA